MTIFQLARLCDINYTQCLDPVVLKCLQISSSKYQIVKFKQRWFLSRDCVLTKVFGGVFSSKQLEFKRIKQIRKHFRITLGTIIIIMYLFICPMWTSQIKSHSHSLLLLYSLILSLQVINFLLNHS
ncbi:hypothetical protein FGO68_gene1520 [Halteria grandinella]|uniref:Transmembrane protein n=1 Tax=Halteria grandinella TaxID=5974 RepID=A0A8J8NFK0_HALGN|nr:hypothetical protein FGO68_gene1520 [Halteria grandinella]